MYQQPCTSLIAAHRGIPRHLPTEPTGLPHLDQVCVYSVEYVTQRATSSSSSASSCAGHYHLRCYVAPLKYPILISTKDQSVGTQMDGLTPVAMYLCIWGSERAKISQRVYQISLLPDMHVYRIELQWVHMFGLARKCRGAAGWHFEEGRSVYAHPLYPPDQHHHQIVSINTFPLLGLVKISLKMVYGNGTTAEVHDIGGGRQYM